MKTLKDDVSREFLTYPAGSRIIHEEENSVNLIEKWQNMTKKHKFYWYTLRPLVIIFLFFKFGYRFKKIQKTKEPFMVLANHNTDWDPLFVGVSFPKPMFFVASEHIARWPRAYKFIKHAFSPIIRYKGTTAASTVIEMLKQLKKGSSVCMFAEGARSWDGVTQKISPSTGKVVKKAKCGLITYKIQGGYFVSPNWSQGNLRRGPIYGAPVNTYTKEQIDAMSVDEINEIIARDLYEDAYEKQLAEPRKYKGKNLAYKMENLLFKCPECGVMDSMHSQNDTVRCSKCGFNFKYTEYCMLEGGPFTTVKELARWQQQEVARDADNNVSYTSQGGKLLTVANHVETLIDEGPIELSATEIRCGNTVIDITNIQDLAMHGRRAVVFSTKDTYYELLPSEESNVLKYHMLFDEYKSKL